MAKRSLWVVKVGSELVVSGGPLLIRHWMQQAAELRANGGPRVIWVTSGAIATARAQAKRSWSKLPEKQALSAIGQPLVMDAYNLALRTLGLTGAQVLLSSDDINSKKRSRNLQNALTALLKWDAVPVLNENDAVAVEEIEFGDNDALSMRVAKMMHADRLVIMTDVAGLYDADPKSRIDAQLIREMPATNGGERRRLLRAINAEGKSKHGTGGMKSKIDAALAAQRHGVETWLVQGDISKILLAVARNEAVGTRFPARKKRRI